eukprot:CAMPEP_0170511334 /NCGR_PEP_ID=MMETSP0208-20121228/66251_1 /TAXON_ID=197538 /ORGANISM="Strombidium inclinatum, Strain S3" /LENGTH=84 /DNA_ID=CAMNT_0010794869 /DNA_START=54 /DNA_END=308 /DNA_ORIENTATION=+
MEAGEAFPDLKIGRVDSLDGPGNRCSGVLPSKSPRPCILLIAVKPPRPVTLEDVFTPTISPTLEPFIPINARILRETLLDPPLR